MSPDRASAAPSSPPPNAGGCVLRVLWMLAGNAFLLIAALKISQKREQFFSAADPVFWGIVLAVAFFRYLDIRRYDGHTAGGRPATWQDYRRYLALLGGFALVLWLIAHALSYAAR